MKIFKPTYYCQSIYDIDLEKLKKQDIKLVLFDLDNTLAHNQQLEPSAKIKTLIKKYKRNNIEVVIVSNNKKERVEKYCQDLNIMYFNSSFKPLKFTFKKLMKKFNNINLSQIIMIGDQVLTDIAFANRNKIKSILVKPIKTSAEPQVTKINRKIEKKILAKLKANKELKPL